jgi:outer membrane protein assembly factor BamB
MSQAGQTLGPSSETLVQHTVRKPNWIALGAIFAGAALLYTGIQYAPDDNALRTLATGSLIMLTGFAIWLWLVYGRLFSPVVSKRLLIGGVASMAALVVLGIVLFEDVRFTGDMRPSGVLRAMWRPARNDAQALLPKGLETQQGDKQWWNTSLRYSQFLGPDRRPMIEGVKLDRNWDKDPPKLLWKQPIGEGWSSFAVYGELAITQEQLGEQETVTCYRIDTGEKIWEHVSEGRFAEFMGGDGPRATPTIVDQLGGVTLSTPLVCTLGAFGELNLLDLTTGKPRWPARNILKDANAENLQWAMSGSPLIYDDMIVVSPGGLEGKSLAAYDLRTGEPKWFGGNSRAAYCSPTYMTIGGVPQVVIVNQDNVTGHDAATGAVLWEHPWPGAQPKVSQPVQVADDRVFCSTGYGIGCMLLELKPDGAGKFTTTDLYGGRNTNMKTKFTNVAIRDGYVYGLDDGILECLEIETGEKRWKSGRFGHGQVLLVDDLLLVLGEQGEMVMVEATPEEFREIGRFQAIEGKTWNNPVLVGNYLLMRNDQEAACYEVKFAPENSGNEEGSGSREEL